MSASDHLSPAQFPYGSVVHRGVTIAMTHERAARFHAAQTPEEKAQIVLEHINAEPKAPGISHSYREGWGGQTGQHWSNSQSVARGFSRPNDATQKDLQKYGLPGDVPVILHAQAPAQSQRYTPRGQKWRGSDHPSEDEVTLRANASVHLKGMTFPRHGEWGKPSTDKPGDHVALQARLRAGRYPEREA